MDSRAHKLLKIQNKELKRSQHNQHKTVSQLDPDNSMTIIDEFAVEVLGGGAPTLLRTSEFLFVETRLV